VTVARQHELDRIFKAALVYVFRSQFRIETPTLLHPERSPFNAKHNGDKHTDDRAKTERNTDASQERMALSKNSTNRKAQEKGAKARADHQISFPTDCLDTTWTDATKPGLTPTSNVITVSACGTPWTSVVLRELRGEKPGGAAARAVRSVHGIEAIAWPAEAKNGHVTIF
jgi:hypothetical protein